ncbi:uncharacterized protein LOC135473361 [Liolophura sinensis]|uniref:uncharacterized protein LOC135473361 n=1 Tax=Liolophura sinensis TaxID=3198878 RepID=UPI00315800FB
MASSDKFMLLLRLTLSLLCAIINGIDLSFNVYAVILKETFNFTQTQVEITASMSCVGFGLSFLEMLSTGYFGYSTTFVGTWILVTLSSGLFCMAAWHRTVFHYWPSLVYLIQLGMSTGGGVAYMVVTRVCLEVIPERHTGKFIGAFGSAICFGKIFFAALFEVFFHGDMAGFFLCLSIMFAVLLGLCYLALYPVTINLPQGTFNFSGHKDITITSSGNVIRSPFFHMTFWTSIAVASAGYTVLNNITSITDSIGNSDSFSIVTTMSVCIMVTRLTYGFVFDKVPTQACGFWLLYSAYFIFGAGLLLGMFYLTPATVYLHTVLAGFGVGPALFLPLAMLVEEFGRQSYTFISGAVWAGVAVLELSMQIMTGFFYDNISLDVGRTDNYCQGPKCFFFTFAVLLAIIVFSFVIQVINFVMYTRARARERRVG